ncbi:MAG: hypothetical protein E7396_05420 [Ruminococcaceae bacterium]|nr:hypothetical protein [Oscillospiraceae bacterium]
MNLLCYTLALENNGFFRFTCDMFFDRLLDLNISHSMYYTKSNKKIVIKLFITEEKLLPLSEVLSEYIIENYCKKTAISMIDKNYPYFTDEEKTDIINRLFQRQEREKIKNLISEYLMYNDRFYPEGFATFRLSEFYECMDDTVSVIVDEMLLNKEYMEFVKILKQFVALNDSGVFAVNIYKPYQGNYILLDENNKKISLDAVNELSFEVAEEELSIQDMLLSDLVSLSPRMIIVHNRDNFDNPKLLKTLETVFEGSLMYCEKCNMCEKFFRK